MTTLTRPPLEQNVRARAPPRALPASHFAGGRRMAAKAPRGAMEILGRALSGSKSAEPPLRAGLRKKLIVTGVVTRTRLPEAGTRG